MFHKIRALTIGSLLALSLASMPYSTQAANGAQNEPKPANKLSYWLGPPADSRSASSAVNNPAEMLGRLLVGRPPALRIVLRQDLGPMTLPLGDHATVVTRPV